MSRDRSTLDPFDRARSIAATGMFMAALCVVVGALLNWVSIEPPPIIPIEQADQTIPFAGIDTRDGKIVLVAGIVLGLCAVWLVVSKRGLPGIIGMLASILIGGIAFADFRAVEDPASGLMRRMERVGAIDPGIGLTLVAVGGILGLITTVAAIAASPRVVEEEA